MLPGLIDLHVHLTSQSSPSEYAERMSINPADEAIRGTVYAEPSQLADVTELQRVDFVMKGGVVFARAEAGPPVESGG